ncbi:nickel ABC transporter substrate-binding protein [Cohnella sp.]|uniref:staphylopine-dependent metal ABC transporter substrate-binding lipoprotein n=1 Tax=Cohnella sp. TaxID=1883426 RepID=UPI0035690502
MKFNSYTLILCAIFVFVLAGCAGEKKGASENEAQQSKLVVAVSKDINDMNPHLYPGSMFAQGMVYESLVENTTQGIQPLLAESWDISEDGTVYTFRLRKDVVFHDGEPFNAEAVKLNMEAVQRNGERHAWIKLSTKLKEIVAEDEYTLRLVLSEPYYPTLLELSMTRPYVFLSPKDFVNGETKDGVAGHHGTGPYQLKEHVTEQYAVFTANERYWGGAPTIKEITTKVMPAGETTLLALQKGEIDLIFTDDRGADSIDVESMQRLADEGDYQIVRSEPMNTKMIVANSGNADSPISELAVRQALWHLIDRELISNSIFQGTESPAETLFSANVNYANVSLDKRGYDPAKAVELLRGAGWQAEGDALRKKNDRSLAMKLYYDANSPTQKTQAEWLQSEARKVGMQLDLIGEESSSIASRRSTGEYELMFNQTWGLAYDPQSTVSAFAAGSSYLNATKGIADAQQLYDWIEAVMVSRDEESRQDLYSSIFRKVHEEAIFIPLTNGRVTVLAPSALSGISFKQTQFELPFERMQLLASAEGK